TIDILTEYARRWAIEVTFHDSKGYLGFEEPQGWTRRAVERTAPMAMLLYTLIVLWFATDGHRRVQFPQRPWYSQKQSVTFVDMLRTLRREVLENRFLRSTVATAAFEKTLASLIQLVAWAA
ncbi:unnamed protein product, partial [marine sediment metagenome]